MGMERLPGMRGSNQPQQGNSGLPSYHDLSGMGGEPPNSTAMSIMSPPSVPMQTTPVQQQQMPAPVVHYGRPTR